MTEQTTAVPVSAAPKPPTYAVLHARGRMMLYTEFERRILAAWDEHEAKRAEPISYPFNEDICGFKLASLSEFGADQMMFNAASTAGMGINDTARFRVWGIGLRATAAEIAKLEGLV